MTDNEIAARVRNLLTERSPAGGEITIPHIKALIPTALESWSMAIARDPHKREFLKERFTATVAADGTVDLSSYVDGTTAKVTLKDLRNTILYTTISGIRTTFTWVASQQQLNYGAAQGDQPACFLEGSTLRTRDELGDLTGLNGATIEFVAVNYPSAAAGIPAAVVHDFILFLADMAIQARAINGRK